MERTFICCDANKSAATKTSASKASVLSSHKPQSGRGTQPSNAVLYAMKTNSASNGRMPC